ncbi:MAG: DUF2288 domain-containing protein [Pseudomonadota bacterium]
MSQIDDLVQQEKANILAETAKAPWKELERFYAQGKLILVCDGLDLVEVAYEFSTDNTDKTQQWIDSGKLLRDFNKQANEFVQSDAKLWCVVIKPWILIQHDKSHVLKE